MVAGRILRRLAPDLVVEKVEVLTPELLSSFEITGLLLDIDCTVKPYRARAVPPEVLGWIEELRRYGLGLILVSNGRKGRVLPIARQMALPCIAPAWKPLPFALWRAAQSLKMPRECLAMVGDQIFTDILAARWAGTKGILVRPLLPEEEPWWTRWKRPLERLVIGEDASGRRASDGLPSRLEVGSARMGRGSPSVTGKARLKLKSPRDQFMIEAEVRPIRGF